MDTQHIETKSTDHKSLQALMNYKYNTALVHYQPSNGLSKLSLLIGGLLMAIILIGVGYVLISILIIAVIIGFLFSKIK